jgi:hypothetical protein
VSGRFSIQPPRQTSDSTGQEGERSLTPARQISAASARITPHSAASQTTRMNVDINLEPRSFLFIS